MHNCECGKFEEITRDVPLGPMIHQIDRLMFRNLSSYTADGEEGICRAQIRTGRCQTKVCQSDGKR